MLIVAQLGLLATYVAVDIVLELWRWVVHLVEETPRGIALDCERTNPAHRVNA